MLSVTLYITYELPSLAVQDQNTIFLLDWARDYTFCTSTESVSDSYILYGLGILALWLPISEMGIARIVMEVQKVTLGRQHLLDIE
jgi:hypothetical protein